MPRRFFDYSQKIGYMKSGRCWMQYQNIRKAIFLERPNRFIAHVELGGSVVKVHVKNTGRCRELLVPGAVVYVEDFEGRMGSRKLQYSLIAVEKQNILINMDSQAPNKVTAEALQNGHLKFPGMDELVELRGEYTYGDSRIDFYGKDCCGKEFLLEVKGVTLDENGVARFPDAPTQRGVKHVEELIRAHEAGFEAGILFVIQMKGARRMEPNWRTHEAFGEALQKAQAAGVKVLAYDCRVDPDLLELDEPVEVAVER